MQILLKTTVNNYHKPNLKNKVTINSKNHTYSLNMSNVEEIEFSMTYCWATCCIPGHIWITHEMLTLKQFQKEH